MPKTGDLSVRTLLEKPLAMDHKVAQDTGSAMRGIATLFGQLFVQLPQHALHGVSEHLCQELTTLLGYPIAGLLQHNSQDQRLVPVAICNASHRDGSIPWPTQLATIGLPEHSAIQVCSDAARQQDEPLSTYLKEVRLLAGACVPIKLNGEFWGVLLLLDHRPSAKPAHHTRDILDLVMPLLCSLIEADQNNRARAPSIPAPEPLAEAESSDDQSLLRSELAEARKRLQHLERINLAFEDYGEPMCILDPTGNTIFANKAYRQLIPNPTQSVPTRFETQQMLADPTVSSRIGAAFRGGAESWQEEVALRDSNGVLLPVELRVDVMKNQHGERVGFVALCKDLRARRAVTQRLQLMESVALRTHDAIFITQRHAGPPPRFVTRFANPAFCSLTGFQAEDIHEQEPSFLCGPQTDPAARERLLQASSTQELVEQELLCYRKDGSTFWAELAIFPIKQESEGAELRYVALRDISERKSTQEALRRSEASYRLLADSIVDVVSLHRLDGFVLFVSPSIERLTGLNVVNNIGNLVCERIHPSDRATVQDMLQSTRLHGNARCEWRLQTKAGHYIWLETTARSVAQAESQALQLVCCSRDITERKGAEESRREIERKLQESQKLESLGVLAGGIAHDFNNLLTGILGNASLLRTEAQRGTRSDSYLQQIEETSMRAAELCKQMLAYAGKGQVVPRNINLSQMIEETLPLVSVSSNRRCPILLRMVPSLPAIYADATQMRQVILNLILNATEAVDAQRGKISIGTGVRHIDEETLQQMQAAPEASPGEYVYMEIEDNGCGMSQEVLSRIFDPFYTTKFTGRGLGLSAVLGIVRGHKGAISVRSKVGQGSCFLLIFPAGSRMEISQRPAPAQPIGIIGSGLALVVDDEERVRSVMSRTLATAGFRVQLAADGLEAVAQLRKNPAAVQVILLDVTMPRMSGEETLQRLRKIRRDVPVILMSGFPEEVLLSQFGPLGVSVMLQKPFRPSDVLAAVKRILST